MYNNLKYEKWLSCRIADFALLASRSPEVQSLFGLDRNQIRQHFVLSDLTGIKSRSAKRFVDEK